MNIWQAVVEALDSLLANKLRSSLTILGIVIGVAAVIAMLAVGEGAQQTITGSINEIGSNLLFVFPGNFTEDVSGGKPLTQGDAEAIMDPSQAPSVAQVAPVLSGSARLTYGSETSNTSIEGVTPEYQSVRNFTLSEGEFVNTDNILGRASVVVLGSQTAEKLFGHSDGVVGETIRIEGQPFRVQGVLASKGGGAFGSQDNVALIPFTTAQSRLLRRSNNRVDTIYIQAVSAEAVSQAAEEVKEILRSRHRIGFATEDFTVYTQQDFVATASTITGVLTLFLGGIAA
ncbi:MAG: ABC transporter permease, partial [Chloroflexi bacterium]|nr:ABC transporter permease [Chloroflexota bacterium]